VGVVFDPGGCIQKILALPESLLLITLSVASTAFRRINVNCAELPVPIAFSKAVEHLADSGNPKIKNSARRALDALINRPVSSASILRDDGYIPRSGPREERSEQPRDDTDKSG
jgi:hypothetical protein